MVWRVIVNYFLTAFSFEEAAERSVTDCLLEAIEWLLITRNVCDGGGEGAFEFQKEFLTARVKLRESIRVLSLTYKVGGT